MTRRSGEIPISSSQTRMRRALRSAIQRSRRAVHQGVSQPLLAAQADGGGGGAAAGLPVVGHGQNAEEITQSVINGFFSVEHMSDRTYDDVLQMLAHSGTRWVPTMAVEGGDALLLRDEPERLTQEKFRLFTPLSRIQLALNGSYMKNVPTAILRANFEARLASIRDARARGVKLLAGTDAPIPESFFGPSLHWELERFVQSGASPLGVLRMATQEAAVAVGAPDLGTLAPGKLADVGAARRQSVGGYSVDPTHLARDSRGLDVRSCPDAIGWGALAPVHDAARARAARDGWGKL